LKPWHGLGVLLAAFRAFAARYPPSRLLIVGDGPERAALIENVARQGLTQVALMTGAVPAQDVPQYLASMDVTTAPYPAIDDFFSPPPKIYESWAGGVPGGGARVGQIGELIGDGAPGLLVPAGDAAALADALDGLARDPERRRALGAAARAR